jgi:hypothetical protein
MVFQVPLLGYTLADDTLQQQNMCLSMQQFDIKTTPDQIQSQRCKKNPSASDQCTIHKSQTLNSNLSLSLSLSLSLAGAFACSLAQSPDLLALALSINLAHARLLSLPLGLSLSLSRAR